MNSLVLALVAIIPWLVVCSLVARLASSFHRPPATWFLLALLLSPLLVAVLLLILGDAERAIMLRESEERIRQRHPERTDLREAALNEMQCPHCGATVNPITEDGLHSPETQPWLLICNQCHGAIEPDL